MGMALRISGGEITNGGTFWSAKTWQKVSIGQGEVLPGTKKDTYFRLSPWLLFSLLPVAGILLVDTLPKAVKSAYSAYTDALVFSYVVIVLAFLGVVVGLVGIAFVWDILAPKAVTRFGWRPGEAYYSGTGKKKEDK